MSLIGFGFGVDKFYDYLETTGVEGSLDPYHSTLVFGMSFITNVIRVDNSDMEARRLKAKAYRQFAYTLVNVNWHNWSLTAAAELEGKVDMTKGFAFTSADVIKAFTTDKLLEMITTRIDPEKSIDVNLTMGFKFEDTNERYALEIRRGVVHFIRSCLRRSTSSWLPNGLT